MARRIALKHARRCPDWIVRDDLVAAGLLGLTEAADRYDDTRAEPFGAFAEQRIRGAIMDELRRGDIMPRRVRQAARKVASALRSLDQGGEAPTDQQVADLLGVPVEHYRTDLAHLVHVGIDSLDDKAATLVADEHSAPDVLASRHHVLGQVRDALAKLPQRDVMLLGMYYLEEQTFQEIATAMKITASRVCQLVRRAIERVRELI
ncbi:MAG: sigma-70 family RNA polymerase sigma factor, partial [Deltaproteobacteria bacterium]|nr:sigma-70 family RNA polymerase sigma factor [Deltaproteobacteria bacterium]